MKNITKIYASLSPVTRAFILVGLLLIVIVVLVWPPATLAVITILGALPSFLNALAAFLVALRHNALTGSKSDQ
jgi:hypothetical protein